MITFYRSFVALAAAAGVALGGVAAAQEPAYQPYPYPIYSPWYGHSSTIAEGRARGMAALVRSAGVAELLNSEAAKNYEQARSMYFDNRLKGTQTYFEMRQMNNQYREEMRGQRPTSEQLFRIAQQRAPQPLSPSELDPYSGEIHWPTILMAPNYADYRLAAEELVRKRVADVITFTVDEQTALQVALNGLDEQLKTNITAYDPQDYMHAKNFLQSLAVTVGVGML